MTKVCNVCLEEKPLTEFHRSRGGYKPHCKPCRSELRKSHSNGRVGKQAEAAAHLKSRYGITSETWLHMRDEQNGVCCICQEPTDSFHVDHCHKTGKVRGLLCRACNMGLGHFKDNPERLARAIEYLNKEKYDRQ